MTSPSISSIPEKEKRPTQKRKFQELPTGSKGPAKSHQGSELLKSGDQALADNVRNISTMPAPKKSVNPSLNGMSPPPPRSIPPPPPRTTCPPLSSKVMPPPPPRTKPFPPPPPKFSSSDTAGELLKNKDVFNKSKSDTMPDTLVKLMEYGDEDDDPEEISEESNDGVSSAVAVQKPFWAL